MEKGTKGQTMIEETLRRKLKIEQHETHYKPGVNSNVPVGYAVPAPLVTPSRVLLNDRPIWKLCWDTIMRK
jgi:hypothetical protein